MGLPTSLVSFSVLLASDQWVVMIVGIIGGKRMLLWVVIRKENKVNEISLTVIDAQWDCQRLCAMFHIFTRMGGQIPVKPFSPSKPSNPITRSPARTYMDRYELCFFLFEF